MYYITSIIISFHKSVINPVKNTPALVIEILSEGTRSKDMIDKLNTYMLSGVEEYWIIDTRNQSILIYGFAERGINILKTFEQGSVAESFAFEGLSVDVEALFRDLV